MTRPNPAPVCLRTLGACSCPKCERRDLTWTVLPRSERAEYRGATLDAWRTGDGARWTVLGPDGAYAAGGPAYSMACARGAAREAWDKALRHSPACREPVNHDGPCDPAWDVE